MSDDVKNTIAIRLAASDKETFIDLIKNRREYGFFEAVAPLPKTLKKRHFNDEKLKYWKYRNWGPLSESTYDFEAYWTNPEETLAIIRYESKWSPTVPIARHLAARLPDSVVYIEYGGENSDTTGFALFRKGKSPKISDRLPELNAAIRYADATDIMRRMAIVESKGRRTAPALRMRADVLASALEATINEYRKNAGTTPPKMDIERRLQKIEKQIRGIRKHVRL